MAGGVLGDFRSPATEVPSVEKRNPAGFVGGERENESEGDEEQSDHGEG